MTVDEAVQWLRTHEIPQQYWVVGDLGGGECYGIWRLGEGWQVFYSQRGNADDLGTFASEADAVAAWLGHITRELRVPGPSSAQGRQT